jgi:hypothetical protein
MVGSLSLFSPGSLQGYGTSAASGATAQSLATDGSAVCASLDCGEHGALNRARLQAQFPGLTLFGNAEAASAQQTGFAPVQRGDSRSATGNQGGTGNEGGTGNRSGTGGIATGGGRLAGSTLLTAQEQGRQSGGSAKTTGELSDEEQAQVAKLKQIDAKVRAHERAHAAVGGAHAGAPSYSYTRGPDGQMYATGGEVAIDISPEKDPEATLQKATQIAAAALAPADPSGQDRAVAAAAAQLRLQALAQIREEKRAEQEQQQAEREQARASDAERQQQSGIPAAQPSSAAGVAQPGERSGEPAAAGAATQGEPDRTASGRPPDAARDPIAQERIASAGRQLGRLVGLIA